MTIEDFKKWLDSFWNAYGINISLFSLVILFVLCLFTRWYIYKKLDPVELKPRNKVVNQKRKNVDNIRENSNLKSKKGTLLYAEINGTKQIVGTYPTLLMPPSGKKNLKDLYYYTYSYDKKFYPLFSHEDICRKPYIFKDISEFEKEEEKHIWNLLSEKSKALLKISFEMNRDLEDNERLFIAKDLNDIVINKKVLSKTIYNKPEYSIDYRFFIEPWNQQDEFERWKLNRKLIDVSLPVNSLTRENDEEISGSFRAMKKCYRLDYSSKDGIISSIDDNGNDKPRFVTVNFIPSVIVGQLFERLILLEDNNIKKHGELEDVRKRFGKELGSKLQDNNKRDTLAWIQLGIIILLFILPLTRYLKGKYLSRINEKPNEKTRVGNINKSDKNFIILSENQKGPFYISSNAFYKFRELMELMVNKSTKAHEEVWKFLDKKIRNKIENIINGVPGVQINQNASIEEIIKAFNELLNEKDLYDKIKAHHKELYPEGKELLKKGLAKLKKSELRKFNALLLDSVFAEKKEECNTGSAVMLFILVAVVPAACTFLFLELTKMGMEINSIPYYCWVPYVYLPLFYLFGITDIEGVILLSGIIIKVKGAIWGAISGLFPW